MPTKKNPANSVVALKEALGSRTAEIPATPPSSITRGTRALRPVEVKVRNFGGHYVCVSVYFIVALAPANAPMARTTAFITPPAPCPKCGVTKKSGKRSCCARGGAWFENCGDPGDSKFDHTWDEGVGACKSNPLTAIQTDNHSDPPNSDWHMIYTVVSSVLYIVCLYVFVHHYD